jgi:hypothetical protein
MRSSFLPGNLSKDPAKIKRFDALPRKSLIPIGQSLDPTWQIWERLCPAVRSITLSVIMFIFYPLTVSAGNHNIELLQTLSYTRIALRFDDDETRRPEENVFQVSCLLGHWAKSDCWRLPLCLILYQEYHPEAPEC